MFIISEWSKIILIRLGIFRYIISNLIYFFFSENYETFNLNFLLKYLGGGY